MLKSIVEFGLTRRLTVILGLVAFIIFGAFSFARLNIEAYPNPAPVILEISAQAPGLSAEEMEKYYMSWHNDRLINGERRSILEVRDHATGHHS